MKGIHLLIKSTTQLRLYDNVTNWRYYPFTMKLLPLLLMVLVLENFGQVPKQQRQTTRVPKVVSASDRARVALGDGLYVNGLRLTGGVSHDKVRAKFGPDDERYGQPGEINYRWEFKDGSFLTMEFDSIGSLQKATLAAWGKRLNSKTFAVLDGKRIVPGQTTLGELRKQFPRGELGEATRGEGWNFLDYTVQFAGEGSEIMSLGISWTDLTDSANKTVAQRNRLKVKTIEVGFTNANLKQ